MSFGGSIAEGVLSVFEKISISLREDIANISNSNVSSSMDDNKKDASSGKAESTYTRVNANL